MSKKILQFSLKKQWLKFKVKKYNTLWIGLIYSVVLFAMALWVRDIPSQYDVYSATLQDIVKLSALGDPKYFAAAAIDITNNGWISSENEWVFNLWPPGFVLLEALIVTVFGLEAPVILVMQILAVCLFTIALTLLYKLLKKNVNEKIAFFMPILIFAFPVSRVFLLQPVGISLGESFAIGFFMIGLLLTLQSVLRKRLYYSIIAGLCLALSAYFRSQFEIILIALTMCGLLILVVANLKPLKNAIDSVMKDFVLKTIVIMLLVSHAGTLPWRVYHWVNQGSPQWVHTASVTFANSVSTSDDLISRGGGFVVAGGGNLTCRIDPVTCGDTVNAKQHFINTFLFHMDEWYALKLEVIGKYWFSSVSNWSSVGSEPSFFDYAINTIILSAIVLVFALSFIARVRLRAFWFIFVWFSLSLLVAYSLIFTVQQFEVRYFYFPKIMGVVLLIILIGQLLKNNGVDDKL